METSLWTEGGKQFKIESQEKEKLLDCGLYKIITTFARNCGKALIPKQFKL